MSGGLDGVVPLLLDHVDAGSLAALACTFSGFAWLTKEARQRRDKAVEKLTRLCQGVKRAARTHKQVLRDLDGDPLNLFRAHAAFWINAGVAPPGADWDFESATTVVLGGRGGPVAALDTSAPGNDFLHTSVYTTQVDTVQCEVALANGWCASVTIGDMSWTTRSDTVPAFQYARDIVKQTEVDSLKATRPSPAVVETAASGAGMTRLAALWSVSRHRRQQAALVRRLMKRMPERHRKFLHDIVSSAECLV